MRLPDPLAPSHLAAAQSLARGETEEQAAVVACVSRSTIQRWRKVARFEQAIRDHSGTGMIARAVSESSEQFDLLKTARDSEILLTKSLATALHKIIALINDRLDGLTDEDIEGLSLKNLPPLARLVSEGIGVLQQSHDRLTGFGLLVKELEIMGGCGEGHDSQD